ncbi:MAG TPA: AEC family transporter [Eubacteriaceae bacterium]|nr:AEC family transporter [Eubacteriaceae bacterium]
MDFLITLQNVSVLFLLIIVGFIVGKLGIISENGQKELSNFVLKVTLPATIILALQLEYTRERFNISLNIMLIMIIVYVVTITISKLLSRYYRVSTGQRDIIEVASVLPNTSFMGYPIVLSILGEEALFYAVLGAGLVFELIAWTYGNLTISKSNGPTLNKRIIKTMLLSPGILSIAIGFTLFILRIKIPEPINSTLGFLSQASSPLAMIVVGILLSRSDIKKCILDGKLFLVAITRLLVFPFIVFITLNTLGVEGIVLTIPIVMLSMPPAAYVAMFSANANNDTDLASQIIFIASLFSVITIPLTVSLVG